MDIEKVELSEQDKKDFDTAKLLLERGNVDEAAGLLMAQLNKRFADPVILFYLGCCFISKKQFGMAANVFRSAISYQNDFPEALQNLGACFRATGDYIHAEEIFRAALLQAKANRLKAEIMGNIAGLYGNNGTPQKALDLYDEALKFLPGDPHLLYNTGFAHLELGNWKKGFPLYDTGFAVGQRVMREYPNVPVWDGGSLAGKRVIVWGDQGIGDEIMSASCIPDLMRDAKSVVFDCHPRLIRLFEKSFPGIECYGTRKTQQVEWIHSTVADVSISITSLMTIYRSDGNFPGTPYIKTSPAAQKGSNLRVGIAWSGGYVMTRSDKRNIDLDTLLPVLSVPGIDWYSLQYQPGAAADVASFEERSGIHIRHFPGKVQCTEYSDTADFVSGLDLVISVCTSAVHLAGSIGKETWCLTPAKPAWRYGIKGPMPFYRSVELYRADTDDWGPTVARMAIDLAIRLKQRMAAE